MFKCTLHKDGMKVSEGYGACSSKERKYLSDRNDKHFLFNTILKMAKKRAYVDSTITAWGLSGIFSQDMEDLEASPVEKEAPPAETKTPAHEAPKDGPDPVNGGKDGFDKYAYYRAKYFAAKKIQSMNADERHNWNLKFIGTESSQRWSLTQWNLACELAKAHSEPMAFTITGEENDLSGQNDPEGKKALPHFDQKNGNNTGITSQQMTAIGKLCELKGYQIKENLDQWTTDQAGQAIQFLNEN
jgi:hypothetical protein